MALQAPARIIVVDDDSSLLEALEMILAGAGHDLATSHPDPALRSMPILVKPFNLGELFAAADRVLTAA